MFRDSLRMAWATLRAFWDFMIPMANLRMHQFLKALFFRRKNGPDDNFVQVEHRQNSRMS